MYLKTSISIKFLHNSRALCEPNFNYLCEHQQTVNWADSDCVQLSPGVNPQARGGKTDWELFTCKTKPADKATQVLGAGLRNGGKG